jgi:excisionase family DNA binding protein
MTCAHVSSGLGYAVIRYIGTRGGVFTDSMAPKIDTEKLVTVTQAAKLLKITPAAIHKAIKRGRLPYIKLGGIFLIQRADLIKYNKSKSVGGRPKK